MSNEIQGQPQHRRFQLQCSGRELRQGLKSFRELSRRPARFRAAKGAIEFDGRFMSLVCPGHAVSFNASGEWPGRATFSVNLISAIMRVAPTGEHITIETDTHRLTIGTTSVACTWQAAMIEDSETFFSLPEPTDHLHMLQMLSQYGRDALYAQGYQKQLKNAGAWRTRQINIALQGLAEFGVTFDDISHVVNLAITRQKDGKAG